MKALRDRPFHALCLQMARHSAQYLVLSGGNSSSLRKHRPQHRAEECHPVPSTAHQRPLHAFQLETLPPYRLSCMLHISRYCQQRSETLSHTSWTTSMELLRMSHPHHVRLRLPRASVR
ncbi:unnamed protein product [Arctogadus glacialis]